MPRYVKLDNWTILLVKEVHQLHPFELVVEPWFNFKGNIINIPMYAYTCIYTYCLRVKTIWNIKNHSCFYQVIFYTKNPKNNSVFIIFYLSVRIYLFIFSNLHSWMKLFLIGRWAPKYNLHKSMLFCNYTIVFLPIAQFLWRRIN